MKIEKQIVSLKLAKQLKKAGYPQEGLWWWVLERHCGGKPIWILLYEDDKYFKEWVIYHNRERYVAPTVVELGEELPSQIEYNGINTLLIIKKGQDYTVGYCNDKRLYEHYEIANIEADARAKMWLYLKKNLLNI